MTNVVIGIDIGGTNTLIGIITIDGKVLSIIQISTSRHKKFNTYINSVFSTTEKLILDTAQDVEIMGVGIGAPNGNSYSGCIENAMNLNWTGIIPICKTVEQHFKCPVFLTNDANAAAMGEFIYGGAKNMTNFIVVTLGTGLGSGIFVDGKISYGHDGFAGELGHTTIVRNGRQCNCGRRGCLETYVSATGIKRTVFELMADMNTQSKMRNTSFSELTAFQITKAAEAGDKLAQEAFRITGMYLGQAFANVAALYSPEAFFIFGGLARAGNLIIEPTTAYMEQNILGFMKNKIKVLKSEINEKAAIFGAGALAWNEIEKNKPF